MFKQSKTQPQKVFSYSAIINKEEIAFTDLKYNSPVSQSLIIKNDGNGILQYDILASVDDEWLKIKSDSPSTLRNGESHEIIITAHINLNCASKIKEPVKELQSIINIKNSNDTVLKVKVKATYKKSCFGTDLTTLCINQRENNRIQLIIPKEIYALTKWLSVNAAKTPGLFTADGIESERIKICHLIEDDAELSSSLDPLTVGDVLIELLKSINMNSKLITQDKLNEILRQYESNGDKDCHICEIFLYHLEGCAVRLFTYMVSFFKYLLNYREYNLLTKEKIGKC